MRVPPSPLRAFYLLLCVFAGLVVLWVTIPKDGITWVNAQGETVQVLSFFGPSASFQGPRETKDISEVLDIAKDLESLNEPEELWGVDSVNSGARTINLDDILATDFRIQFPAGTPGVLTQFFRALDQAASGTELIRVLHYGDSQLEGDRITSRLRQQLQGRFGGCGVGLVPIKEFSYQKITIKSECSKNWLSYPIYGNGYISKADRNYSLMGGSFAFTPRLQPAIIPDTAAADSLPYVAPEAPTEKTAWVRYQRSKNTTSGNKRAEQIRLLYGKAPVPFEVAIASGSDTIGRKSLPATQGFGVQILPTTDFTDLSLTFRATESPLVYGLAFDCQSGVAVDNMAFRGSSGVEFSRMNMTYLAQQIRQLDVRLLILQFGVNVVPGEAEAYGWYEQRFYNQLRALKALSPDLSILVISVSDMAKKVEEDYVSYPNVVLIRDAQKNAAFRSGCAYWDLHEAMGGENSMAAWVDKGLAAQDYTHFSASGARIVADLIFNALMLEYKTWKGAGS